MHVVVTTWVVVSAKRVSAKRIVKEYITNKQIKGEIE